MKLEEFVDIIDVEIEVTHSKNAYMPLIAKLSKSFHSIGFKKNKLDGLLASLHSGATTPDKAVRALAKKLSNGEYTLLVVYSNSSTDARQTFNIPENLE